MSSILPLLALLLLLSLLKLSNATVNFTQNYNGNACPNTTVVLTCITSGSDQRLAWSIPGNNQVFRTSDQSLIGRDYALGPFTVRLISIVSSTITSTASINATLANNGTTLNCSDSINIGATTVQRRLIIATPPSPPLNLANTTITHNSISLSWSPPTLLGGVPINQYIISISPNPLIGECPNEQCLLTDSVGNTTITNLQFGVNYTISMTANNCAGTSNPATLNLNINAEVPAPPTELEICMDGKDMNIKWKCPSSTSILSPPISHFIAVLQRKTHPPAPSLQPLIWAVSNIGCNCYYNISLPVQSSSLYTVTVMANNTVGNSINNPTANIYTSPNITSNLSMITTSTALLAINVSLETCPGSAVDIQVTYGESQSSTNTVAYPVTLPIRTSYIVPLSSLMSDTSYSLSVAIMSEEGASTGPPLSGVEFQTDKDVQPLQCSSQVLTVLSTVTVSSSPMTTGGGQPNAQTQCDNEGTLLLVIGALGAIVAIAIIWILGLVIYIICIRNSRKTRTGELTPYNDITANNITTNDGMSMNESIVNSRVHLISTSSVETGISHDRMDAMTTNDSYGQRPPAPLPNEMETRMYAEVAPRPVVTENPTYVETPLPSQTKPEPLYIEDEKVEASIRSQSSSPVSSPTHDPVMRDDIVNRPADFNKTDSLYLEMSSVNLQEQSGKNLGPTPSSTTGLNVYQDLRND